MQKEFHDIVSIKDAKEISKGKNGDIFEKISALIEEARRKVAATINQEMVVLYWNIGKIIKEEVIKSERAEYGRQIVQSLSGELTQRYGGGFSSQNLWYMVQLYENHPILHAVRGEFSGLSWTHVRMLPPIKDELRRKFYATLCQKEHRSTRTLDERINSMLYERTALSKLPEKTIEKQLQELKEEDKMTPELVFLDPYVLDFLELIDTYGEKDLENSILNALEKFIVELGVDFHFVARQKRIIVDNEDYYIDLLFYHRRLRCFVVMDLKLGKFRAEYKGQMELYLRYLEKHEMFEDENPPIGLIPCAEKGREQIELLFLPEDRIKVSEYLTKLPPKELFAEKLHKAIQTAHLRLEAKKG
ncbi:MAG: cytoplasmic protein [Candidatus Altiarchaeales archaeon WOR_SM1_86-2]|nr:MAG: cytoplasmic protein [Candidatus Altiarchaeales archaeon WOR_SM1_86-2]ODS41319.1 MAG: cytoplasmic protein [Candidatus Altiarchaeales archaeon WOR_SM1_79]